MLESQMNLTKAARQLTVAPRTGTSLADGHGSGIGIGTGIGNWDSDWNYSVEGEELLAGNWLPVDNN